jgi:transcriptional regulator with XRE-family HTH domain
MFFMADSLKRVGASVKRRFIENQNTFKTFRVNHGLIMKKSLRDTHAETFADYVIEGLERTGIKQAELARRTKLTPQLINQIVNKKPHGLTGKLLLPGRETVDKIAKAFGDTPTKARRAAGYSDINGSIETIEQLLDASLYWEAKGLSDEDKEKIRPLLELIDREMERLAGLPRQHDPKKIVDIDDVPSQARKIKNKN